MRIHVVHGILDRVGASGLLEIVPHLQQAGFDVRVPDYGLITAGETRIVNPLIVRTLRPYVEAGDVYVGHSNGCAIGYDLMASGSVLSGAVFINAALKRDITVPALTWVDVYYNNGDEATVAAVAAARLGLSDPVWGDMGHAGYDGLNHQVTNIDCGQARDGLPAVCGHSDIFAPDKFRLWAPYIVGRITARMAAQARMGVSSFASHSANGTAAA